MRRAPVFTAALLLSDALFAGVAFADNGPANSPAEPPEARLNHDQVDSAKWEMSEFDAVVTPRDATGVQAAGTKGKSDQPAVKTELIESIDFPRVAARGSASETVQTGQVAKRKPPGNRRSQHRP